MTTFYADVTSRRRKTILTYIIDYKSEHDGLSPTMREIATACEVSTTSLVAADLEALSKDGKIELMTGQSRGIKVVGGCWLPPVRLGTLDEILDEMTAHLDGGR